jgi:hypothetical protein
MQINNIEKKTNDMLPKTKFLASFGNDAATAK